MGKPKDADGNRMGGGNVVAVYRTVKKKEALTARAPRMASTSQSSEYQTHEMVDEENQHQPEEKEVAGESVKTHCQNHGH